MTLPFISLSILGALTQAIRNFAKSLEGWLTNAMSAIPQKMIQTKVVYHCSLLVFYKPEWFGGSMFTYTQACPVN